MRITNYGQQQQLIAELQARMAQFNEANRQLSTGQRFDKASDDPIGAKDVMVLSTRLTGLDQFDRNANFAKVRQQSQDAVLTQVGTLLDQARGLAADAGGSAIGSSQRVQASAQIDQILKEVIAYANTQVGGEYIFAGGNSATQPFINTPGATQGNYQGGTVTRSTDIDPGVSVVINDRGDQLFGDPAAGVPGIISSLKNLRDGLAGAAPEASSQILTTRLTDLVNASNQLTQARVTVAGRLSQIDRVTTQHTSQRADLQTQRDAIQAVDPNEAAARLLALQTSIQAAYSATSRVLSASLVNYLPSA